MIRMRRTRALLSITVFITLVAAGGSDGPQTVSPGAPDRIATIRSDCPTFNWTQVPGAAWYELVVVPLAAYTAPVALPDPLETEGVLYEQVPGGATGWTPDLSRCLTPAEGYAWFVRALFEGNRVGENEPLEPGDWSPGRLFRVAAVGEIPVGGKAFDDSQTKVFGCENNAWSTPVAGGISRNAVMDRPASDYEHRGLLVDADGEPVEGSYDLELRIWDRQRGGEMIWGPQTVPDVVIVRGDYEVTLHDLSELPAESLFLEVTYGEEIVSPRQRISLALPVSRSITEAALEMPVLNAPEAWYGLIVDHAAEEGARGAYFRGDDYGIYAEEVGAGDVGIRTPDYVHARGFRSDTASYLWVPATAGAFYPRTDCSANPQRHGSVRIHCSAMGTLYFQIPIALPGILFGQSVSALTVRVFYDLESADAYIQRTELRRQTAAGESVSLFYDETARTSTTPTSYSLEIVDNGTLDAASGMLNLELRMWHDGSIFHDIYIGGIGVMVGHQP